MFDGRGSRKYLNAAERQAFFHAAQREPDAADRAFCLTLYYTGCRISEALNLTGERVDASQQCVVFETLKRRKRGVFRTVPVPDELIKLLAGMKNDSRCLWTFSRVTAYRLVKRCLHRADVRGAMASPKGLRHGFAIACISHDIPLTAVKKWMGHARLETTEIYLDVGGHEERQLARRLWRKKAVKKFC